MKFFSSPQPLIWSRNEDGIAVRFPDHRRYVRARDGRASEPDRMAFVRMQMLLESGQARVGEVEEGIFIATADAVRLDAETRESFSLPPTWPGGMRLQTESAPQLSGFRARLGLVHPGSFVDWDWRLAGPILETGGAFYLPSALQHAVLVAYGEWSKATSRDEAANLQLLIALREAWREGCQIDLEAYRREAVVVRADEFLLDAREEEKTGDLILRPVLRGDFPDLDADRVEERMAQFQVGGERAVLRDGKTIVLLDPVQTAQARAVAARGRVPRRQRATFEKDPSRWLADNVFPDIETDFSPRVIGVGAWKTGYLGANWEKGLDWFQKRPESEKRSADWAKSRSGGDGEDREGSSTPEREKAQPLVPLIVPNDEELGYGWRFPELESENAEPFEPDFSKCAREPMTHQEEAARWLLAHARRALQRAGGNAARNGFGAGALLADDMGLGKTFSTLIFLAEWLDLWQKTTGSKPPAVLIAAPLSLLENWKEEISKSYGRERKVFTRVLLVQAEGDLAKVRRAPGSRDVVSPSGEVKQYGLGFGDGTERSVDYPGGCILTTYQTLREYRFSFAKAEWSAAIFDEAQNIKNPNALQTISAKALNALFRLALTGTPVENHLGDFWSILDAVEPGPLGSFVEFRRDWILRMEREKDRTAEIGRELRNRVGGLMLRRMKEALPDWGTKKEGGVDPVCIGMTAEQIELYDDALAAARQADGSESDDEDAGRRQGRQLAALWQLRQICLHPDLLGGGHIETARGSEESRRVLQRSGKLAWLLECLDGIWERGEKALVFCVQKRLQEALALHLGQIYELPVPVINGDTKATSRRNSESTRLGLIAKFSDRPGFGVCILSPIAAGAGLNIVAANHVIHLERHWNPAKEDQATDRAYRIGQTRTVHVYLPTVTHPRVPSFDLILHRLMDKKRRLQSAVELIPPEAVSGPELMNGIFGHSETCKGGAERIDVAAALRLSWRLFEALIACLYKQDARQVFLTPAGVDHGCDVVILGWGANRENLLIQCKLTSRDKLDSELAVRQIEGARPYYEQALDVVFHKRCLQTTAKKFSRRSRRAAQLCDVLLNGCSWLDDALKKVKVSMADVLAADARRKRIE